MKHAGSLALGLLALSACQGSASDQGVFVTVANPAQVAGIVGLRVSLSNQGASDVLLFPASASSTSLSFPATLSFSVPAGRGGQVDVAIQALDAAQIVVASGSASVVLQPGTFVPLEVVLVPAAGSTADAGVPDIDAQAAEVGNVGIEAGTMPDLPIATGVEVGAFGAETGAVPDVPMGTGGAGGSIATGPLDAPAVGGAAGSGGGGGAGGIIAAGGALGSGGVAATGGLLATGGIPASGGAVGTGGTAVVDCGALIGPANGSVIFPSTTLGSTATYVCSAGFNMVGGSTRTCQAEGTWGGAAPTCTPVDCGALSPPANGAVSAPTTTYGSTVTYSCTSGHSLSGNATRTCQANGTWSGSMPACVPNGTGGATGSGGAVGSGGVVGTGGRVGTGGSAPAPVCSPACSSGFRCCDGSDETCHGTKLPSGDGPNTGEFVVSGDSLTVTDTITGLTWQRDGSGTRSGCSGTGNLTCTWAEAAAYCSSLAASGYAGFSDWRLPARMELITILYLKTGSGVKIDSTKFPGTPAENFWTSTPVPGVSTAVYLADFASGWAGTRGASYYFRVRCVR